MSSYPCKSPRQKTDYAAVERELQMGWNLPPGTTDKDIDDAAPQEELVQCDCCSRMFPADQMVFIRHDHPNSNVHVDTTACPQCRGEK